MGTPQQRSFFQVRDSATRIGHYQLCFGDAASHRLVSHGHFHTVHEAKAACWREYHEIAIRVWGDEALFDSTNPLHRALARIEARHSGLTSVVAVAPTWYSIRRSKFNIEVRVGYEHTPTGGVRARHDEEPVIVSLKPLNLKGMEGSHGTT